MMSEQHYGTLDRQPARELGMGRVFLWCLGALVVASAMSFAADILFYDVLDAAIDPFTGGGVVPGPVALIGSGLLVGGSIGLVIGSRVDRARLGCRRCDGFLPGLHPVPVVGLLRHRPVLVNARDRKFPGGGRTRGLALRSRRTQPEPVAPLVAGASGYLEVQNLFKAQGGLRDPGAVSIRPHG